MIERDFPIHLDVVTGCNVFVFKGPWPRLLVRSLAYHHGQTLILHEVRVWRGPSLPRSPMGCNLWVTSRLGHMGHRQKWVLTHTGTGQAGNSNI